MKSATEEIQLFRAEQAARLIGGDQESNLIVLKARANEAQSAALTWVNTTYRLGTGEELDTMATREVCPLLASNNRGSLLFPAALDDLLSRIEGAASHEERWGWIQQIRRHDARKLQFHRTEIARWLEHCGIHSAYLFEQSAPARDSGLDVGVLATPTELIAAFGRFTDMDAKWFRKLEGPLLRARRTPGRPGKGRTIEPLFCPVAVMQWLANPRRKKGRELSEDKGWSLLEKHFSRAFNANSAADPRQHPAG